jgi:hypothetical protein
MWRHLSTLGCLEQLLLLGRPLLQELEERSLEERSLEERSLEERSLEERAIRSGVMFQRLELVLQPMNQLKEVVRAEDEAEVLLVEAEEEAMEEDFKCVK